MTKIQQKVQNGWKSLFGGPKWFPRCLNGGFGGVFVLKSGLRILIRAPEVPFLVPPKCWKWVILGVFGYFLRVCLSFCAYIHISACVLLWLLVGGWVCDTVCGSIGDRKYGSWPRWSRPTCLMSSNKTSWNINIPQFLCQLHWPCWKLMLSAESCGPTVHITKIS